jgi:hypothetical protein
MAPTIGFILLTHNKPHQIIRLITTLNRMFDYPPIVCHHDFSQSNLAVDLSKKNVSFVHPHLQTGWAEFSLVDAMLNALKLMYESSKPDWFIFSGADYPIKPAKQILYDLTSSSYDVHMHHEKITYDAYERPWQELCFSRYCTIKFKIPFISRGLRFCSRVLTLKHPLITAPFLPFNNKLRCFAGEFWFCANRKSAEYLIEFHSTRPALASHYRRLDSYRICPEESYYQTVFCNAPHLKVSPNNWRYIDWSAKGAHPKTLLFEDLPKIYASTAHFARKFDIDADVRVLNELDDIIG